MEHGDSTYVGMGGVELFYQWWRPQAEPRALVAFVHGIGGHSSQATYVYLIDHLVELGYSLYGLDLRGHGCSQGQRGHINSWDEYRGDLRIFLELIREVVPGRPIFLLGQSLGALIVLEYALRYPEGLRGVIASAPPFSEPKVPAAQRALLTMLTYLRPAMSLHPKFDATGVSRDPEEVDKLLADPLTDPQVSPRLFREVQAAVRWTQAHAAGLQVPLLLMHGAADPITPPAGSQIFFESLTFEDTTFISYEGGYHQAFIDTNRQQALADVTFWLDQHL